MEQIPKIKLPKEYKALSIAIFGIYFIAVMLPIFSIVAPILMAVALGLMMNKFGFSKGIVVAFLLLLMDFLTTMLAQTMAVAIILPNVYYVILCGFAYAMVANRQMKFAWKSVIVSLCAIATLLLSIYDFADAVNVASLQKVIMSTYQSLASSFAQVYASDVTTGQISQYVSAAINQMVFLAPAIIVVVGALGGGAICYIGQYVRIKLFKEEINLPMLSSFKSGKPIFVGIILSLAVFIFAKDNKVWSMIGGNIFYIISFVCLINGLAMLDYFAQRLIKIPAIRYAIYILTLIIPYFGWLFVAAGAIDSLTKMRIDKATVLKTTNL